MVFSYISYIKNEFRDPFLKVVVIRIESPLAIEKKQKTANQLTLEHPSVWWVNAYAVAV